MTANVFSSDPAGRVEKITKGTALSYGIARALACGTAGTLNFTDPQGGVQLNFPLQAGYNPIAVASVQASGTADDIWALY